MGAGTWTLDLDYDAPSGGGTIDIEINRTNGGPFTLIGIESGVSLAGGTGTKQVEITGSAVDFVKDKDEPLEPPTKSF